MRRIYCLIIELFNQKGISQFLYRFATSKKSRFLIPIYKKMYKVSLEDFEIPKEGFQTLEQFFVRKVKKGKRPIVQGENAIVSPVDGKLISFGEITDDLQVFVKGKYFSLTDMLGSIEKTKRFINGRFAVIYLSPKDYHRIHAPIDGELAEQVELGNRSYPVNELGLRYGKDPLAKNFRAVSFIKFMDTTLALVKIGAMFINTIRTTRGLGVVKKGEEIAYFSFGSTVILLFEQNSISFHSELVEGQSVKMGELLGFYK